MITHNSITNKQGKQIGQTHGLSGGSCFVVFFQCFASAIHHIKSGVPLMIKGRYGSA